MCIKEFSRKSNLFFTRPLSLSFSPFPLFSCVGDYRNHTLYLFILHSDSNGDNKHNDYFIVMIIQISAADDDVGVKHIYDLFHFSSFSMDFPRNFSSYTYRIST